MHMGVPISAQCEKGDKTVMGIRMSKIRTMLAVLPALTLSLLAGPAAQAQTSSTGPVTSNNYLITIDASALTANASYSLDFQLSSGDFADGTKPTGDGTTTLTLSAFTFPGMATAPAGTTVGGATASGGIVTLTDSGTTFPTAEFIQPFTATGLPGQTVSFNLVLTSVTPQLKSPDQFTFALLNSAGTSALPTADPFGTLLVNFNLPKSRPVTGATLTNFNTGLVTIAPAPVPEASTTISLGLLLTLGLGGLIVSARRKASLPR